VWRRERVGRNLMEAVDEDPTMLGEKVVGEDLVALGEAAVVEAWRRTQRSGPVRRGSGSSR
jgi:hypothetical protein